MNINFEEASQNERDKNKEASLLLSLSFCEVSTPYREL